MIDQIKQLAKRLVIRTYNQFVRPFVDPFVNPPNPLEGLESPDKLQAKIDKGRIDINRTHSVNGGTALHHYAKANQNTEFLSGLLEAGSNPNLKDNAGNTALMWSVANSNNDTAIWLIETGAEYGQDLDIRSKYGRVGNTPLTLSLAKGWNHVDDSDPQEINSTTPHSEVIKSLLSNGANPNRPDFLGNSPLHIAAIRRDVEAVELLLEHGANMHQQNQKGETPRDMLSKSFKDTEQFLTRNTCDVFSLNINQWNACRKECAELLQTERQRNEPTNDLLPINANVQKGDYAKKIENSSKLSVETEMSV